MATLLFFYSMIKREGTAYMKWEKYTLITKTDAVDILSASLGDIGVEGIEIEDCFVIFLYGFKTFHLGKFWGFYLNVMRNMTNCAAAKAWWILPN